MAAGKHTELLLEIDEKSALPIYRQLYEQIRTAIEKGKLPEGAKLPSIRRLASDLRISHTTIEQAYQQLSVEGYVENVPRSGYKVAHVDIDYMTLSRDIDESELVAVRGKRNSDAFFAENRSGSEALYDFSYANLQPDSFPANTWRKLIADVLYRTDCPELSRYAYTDEPSNLSNVLASHLARTRGVRCIADQILIQAGTDGALATILQLFDRAHDTLGMEEPGYATVHEVAKRQGFSMCALPTDRTLQEFFSALEAEKPRIVFVTPSHQFPTGRLLPLEGRIRLLQWAEANDAYIIEDDSCNEFRYTTRPIPSLQSLDAYGRVVYLCNVSKVLAPGLRIAYLVLPPALLERYWNLFNFAHPPVSWLEQEALARFISEGHWDAHARRTARVNHKNNDRLLQCLHEQLDSIAAFSGADTGMHVFATISNGMSQQELLSSALAQGAKVYGTGRMWFSKPAPENNVMIGFSSIAYNDIEPGVQALRRAWVT